MGNDGIASIFLEIANLLDLEGVKFKPEAYRRAARTLQDLPDDVRTLVARGTIDDVPGIGKALAEKVREYVATGEVPYLARLRSQWPPGLLSLMKMDGVGPKTTRRFYLEFQVTGPEDLKRLIDRGGLQGVAGFGEKKIHLLQKAVTKALAAPGGAEGSDRRPLPEAQLAADEILRALRGSGAPLETLVFAGSLRRRKETVGDLDILATSARASDVMAVFTHLPDVGEVKLSGPTKSTVVLRGGLQVDLRVVPPEAFGAALQYFTGSKDHNVRLRSLANQKGLSINEYGMTRGGTLVPAKTEEEVYASVGLPWIPPECRENHGEIEAAQEGRFPSVVRDADLQGELHIHVPASAEVEDVRPWVEALKERRLAYGGFVVDGEDLTTADRTLADLRESIPAVMDGVALHWGVELTTAPDAMTTKVFQGAEFVVWRPPESRPKEPGSWLKGLQLPPGPRLAFLAHLEVEALGSAGLSWRDLLDPDGDPRPLEVAVTADAVVTETSQAREASQAGLRFVLSGRPRLPDEVGRLDLAAGIARRGWVGAPAVVNAGNPFGPAGRPTTGLTPTGPRPQSHS